MEHFQEEVNILKTAVDLHTVCLVYKPARLGEPDHLPVTHQRSYVA